MQPEDVSSLTPPTASAKPDQPVSTAPSIPPPVAPYHQNSHKSHEGLKSVLSTIAILIIAPLIALLLTTFVFQSYEVDGPSMETTLQNHDRLIVIKFPKTWASLTGHIYIPDRSDIIVFTQHGAADPNLGQDRQLIKRVLGLPGDRVVIKDGVLTIYNTEHPNGYQPDRTYYYGKVIGTTSGNVDLVVGPDEVFVNGDNRGNSLDSRSFGPVKAKDIVGKLEFRIYPFSKADNF